MKTVNFKLFRDSFEHLIFIDEQGQTHKNVTPVRAFPIAAPDLGISLVNQEGRELAWIDTLNDLPKDIALLIQSELAKKEFVPEITGIKSVSSYACPSTWKIQTDRGETELVLKGEEDIRRLSHESLLIADTHGIEYLIRKLSDLDRTSRKILDRFL